MRLVKSDEEIEWLRTATVMTDDAVRALHQHAAPEVSELELSNIVERAYVARGGTTHIHYLAATPMSRPSVCVPAQCPTTRPLAAADALVCEISASYWEYTGQLLRTFAVAAEPTALYRAGFTTRDDLVHGFVGGYLPPVLGTRSRALAQVPEFTFASAKRQTCTRRACSAP